MAPHPWRSGWVAGSYAAGSAVAYWLIHLSDAGAVFFPAAGVSLAALVLSPRSRWPAVLLTVAVTEFVIDQVQGLSIGASLGFAAANSLEPLVGAALLLRATVIPLDLGWKPGLGYFVLYAVVIGPLVGGLIGATTIALTSNNGLWNSLPAFWAGDAMGVLSVGAAVITARQWRRLPLGFRWWLWSAAHPQASSSFGLLSRSPSWLCCRCSGWLSAATSRRCARAGWASPSLPTWPRPWATVDGPSWRVRRPKWRPSSCS